MKRVAYFLLLLAGAALAFSACQTILPEENGQPGVEEVKKGATIWAGFDAPTTKTGLSVNESGTSAQVVWKSGDSFVNSWHSVAQIQKRLTACKRVTLNSCHSVARIQKALNTLQTRSFKFGPHCGPNSAKEAENS